MGAEARPVVKWAGGKRSLLPAILDLAPPLKEIRYYHEPFCGGCSVYLGLRSAGMSPRRSWMNDINEELINCYLHLNVFLVEEVRNILAGGSFSSVVEVERKGEKVWVARDYLGVRDLDWRALTAAGRAARFLFLNRFGFNGLYRVNSKGEFNVPPGYFKSKPSIDLDNLVSFTTATQGCVWSNQDFEALRRVIPIDGVMELATQPSTNVRIPWPAPPVEKDPKNHFVYFDMPYVDVFTSYSKDKFGEVDHRRLAKLYNDVTAAGVRAMLSINDCDLSRELYGHHTVTEVSARNAISCGERSRRRELIVTNY